MIIEYIKEVRLFEILFDDIHFYNKNVKSSLLEYINKYIKYKTISVLDLQKNYESFLKQYSKDVKYYLKNNMYPALSSNYNITRKEYDIFLLLSTILTQHRYDIMCEIKQSIAKSDNALVIGSGVGLEIELIKENYIHISAYDIELDQFCYNNHSKVDFYEKAFKSNKNRRYNDIFIIELLEHVHNPYDLIKDASEVMLNNGRIIITLAVNIPQFDHIVNFNNMNLFLENLDKLDLYVDYKKEIHHKYLMNQLSKSSNIFMILKRKK